MKGCAREYVCFPIFYTVNKANDAILLDPVDLNSNHLGSPQISSTVSCFFFLERGTCLLFFLSQRPGI